MKQERDLVSIGVIPARIASTRLPNKPLLDIQGKSMIQRVYENSSTSKNLTKLIIATDSQIIFDHCVSFGATVVMTDPELPSGTDRIYAAISNIVDEIDLVLNIQGDEPLVSGADLDLLIQKHSTSLCDVGTLVKRIDVNEDIFDSNIVKVVIGTDNKALYFSRSPIPHQRDVSANNWLSNGQIYWKHIGIYSYRYDTLKKFASLPPTDLEISEKLEQLRLMQNNTSFLAVETKNIFISIDTQEDLLKLNNYLYSIDK